MFSAGMLLAKEPVIVANSLQADSSRISSDAWFGSDKAKHFVLSSVTTLFIAKHLQVAQGYSSQKSQLTGAGISISLGLVKEFRDRKRPGNHFCWKDLVADLAGISAGLLLTKLP
ncbi:MAG: hypothetical protein Kow0037_16110 [Calditrichia bacterium]